MFTIFFSNEEFKPIGDEDDASVPATWVRHRDYQGLYRLNTLERGW
jgi:hypothetical protein